MNLNAKSADAEIFSEVLRRAFFSKPENTNLIYPRFGLSSLIEPFEEFLNKNESELYYNSTIDEICYDKGKISGVLVNGKTETADFYISAVPPKSLIRLLKNKNLHDEFNYLNKFTYSTIASAYLWFDRNFADKDLYALINSNIHWIFNRRKIFLSELDLMQKYPGHIALTISGANELDFMDKSELLELLIKELYRAIPEAKNAKLLHSVLIRDKFATFKALPGIITLRPNNTTNYENFFIAGDWTNTGLPATLEGACLSGFKTSENIIEKINSNIDS
jgi:zeta-carotene desaturase